MENISAEELRKYIKIGLFGKTSLDLSDRQLSKVPEAVTDLKDLEELDLSSNHLTKLPTSINKMKNLKRLHLWNNKLTYLPDSIGDLKELRGLNVSNNQLSSVPTNVRHLKKLEWLVLDGNHLTDLPEWIGGLKELRGLTVSNNQLSAVPTHVQHLKELELLYLDGNRLTDLPEWIGDMKELRELTVSNNQLSAVPTNVHHLKKLKVLYLDGNHLTDLPEWIGDLKELNVLNVSNNQLSAVPSYVQHLKKLEVLYLDGNRLTVLPEWIGYLKELRKLYVSDNPFTVDAIRSLREAEDKKKVKADIHFSVPEEVKAQGQRAQLAYKRALKDGSVNVYRGRIFLIGQDRAGKTSLKKSLIGLPFDINEQSTEGIQVGPSAFEVDVDQVKNWQTVDQNSQRLLGYAKAVARMVVERQCHGDDDNAADDYGDDEVSAVSEQTSAQPKLTIDAISLPDEVTNHANEWIKYIKCERVKRDVSKEESIVNMDIWDFAGQHLYYASHPVFFSLQAIYVLVYNLSKSLNDTAQPCARQGTHDVILENTSGETNLENLLSWLSTVHGLIKMREETVNSAHRKLPYLQPPVLIVGTHADKPVEDISAMKLKIQRKMSGKEYEEHVVRPIFSIDNTARSLQHWVLKFFSWSQPEQEGNIDEIQVLRNKIMEVLRQQPYMGQKIPVRWLNFEKVVDALVAKNINHISVEQLRAHARKVCLVKDRDEFNTMVEFYHNLGMIIKHRDTVILKAQWLIDLFKQLITIPHYDKVEPKYSKHWLELEKNGVLSMELLDHVFIKLLLQGVVKDDILHMMERFGLVAKFSPSSSDVKYFVPAQLKASPDDLYAVQPSPSDPCPLFVHFVVGFVPHGLFTQLVSRSIRWCSMVGSTRYPKLYQNGAWFAIGKQFIHHLILICKKRFIKIVLKKRIHSQQVSEDDSTEVAAQVREFVEGCLHDLSQDLPYLRGMQYQLCVACPYCHQGNHECTNHRQTTCTHEDCLHLLEIKKGELLTCVETFCDTELTVHGQEKWFSQRKSQDLHPFPVGPSQSHRGHSRDTLKVTLLASEWGSSKGGLSTMNRTLAILFAKESKVEVTLLVPQFSCCEEDKRTARSHNIAIQEAPRRPGYKDPLDWLSFPPKDLAIDVVLGNGAKLGKQAQVIRETHGCKWVQVVHTAPEELGMYKNYPGAIAQAEEKNKDEVDLCRLADRVVAIGPKLAEAFLSSLRSSHQHIFQLTPGTFREFSDVKQAPHDSGKFRVLTFGRGDFEDFSLKGYDIAAKAIVELKDSSYHLISVGAPSGKQDEVAEKLLQLGISKNQLTVRSFVQSKDELKNLFCEVDLAIMPSRTEGFGLTGLEAMSAGLPILVSGNSGFGESLCSLPFGRSVVVESEDPKEWAKAISAVRQKDRAQRLQEIQSLRTKYEEKFSWEKQCQDLVDNMWKLVTGKGKAAQDKAVSKSFSQDANTGQVTSGSQFTQSVEKPTSYEGTPFNLNQCEEAETTEMTSGTQFDQDSVQRVLRELQQMQHDAGIVASKTSLSVELEKIASHKGFIVSDNEGSGNCMFYALSEQLNLVKGIQISHAQLRQRLVQYLKDNPTLLDGTELFHFVHGCVSWADYLKKMAADGTWADHVILHAAANYFKTSIHVISSLSDRHDVNICPERAVDCSGRLVLGHVFEHHYVSLRPKPGK